MTRAARQVGLALTVAALALSAACTGTDEDPHGEDPHHEDAGAEQDRPAPTLPELSIGDEPLAEDLIAPVNEVAHDESTMAVVTGHGVDLRAHDLATGERAWKVSAVEGWGMISDNLRIIAAMIGYDGHGLFVYDDYVCPSQICADGEPAIAARGLVSLSLQDGSVQWHADLIDPAPRSAPDAEFLDALVISEATLADGVLLVTVEPTASVPGIDVPPGEAAQFTVGLDPDDGSELWRADSFALSAHADGTAWGYFATEGEENTGDAGVPALLDPATGEMLWQSEQEADLAGAGSTGALLELGDEAGYQWLGADGAALDGPAVEGEANCATGPGPLVCSVGSDYQLAALDEAGTVTLSPPTEFEILFTTDGQYIWAVDPTVVDSGRASVAIDAHGNRLSEPVVGRPVFSTADRLMVRHEGPDAPGSEIWALDAD